MNPATYMLPASPEGKGLAAEAASLAPWFHNLHLPDGSQTAPGHPLGDFPAFKWASIARHLPKDLSGWTALDIGCNSGFYSIELARRGASVTAIDKDPHFLKQARWSAQQFDLGPQINVREAQVYDLLSWKQSFDLVLFMGVFYHLRYPLLGLDIVAEKVKRLLVFQTLTIPGDDVAQVPEDFSIDEREQMNGSGWPRMAFVEKRLAGDWTNWWAPNHACVEAMLRTSGLKVTQRIAHEMYLCEPAAVSVTDARTFDSDELRAATGGSRLKNPE